MEDSAQDWIRRLQLKQHPEGGYFLQTYESGERIEAGHLPGRFGGSRAFSSAIYYLLAGDDFSAFHRIKSDEIWHFYAGACLALYVLDFDGTLSVRKLGRNFEEGERFQTVVPAGCWFAARPLDPKSYSLVGCTVAPAFAFEDFHLARRDDLTRRYPQHEDLIASLTRS